MMPNPFHNSVSEEKDFEHHILMHNPAIIKSRKNRENWIYPQKAPPVKSIKESDILEIKTGNSHIFTEKVLGVSIAEFCILEFQHQRKIEYKILFNIDTANVVM
jgi:hypothetical protein